MVEGLKVVEDEDGEEGESMPRELKSEYFVIFVVNLFSPILLLSSSFSVMGFLLVC